MQRIRILVLATIVVTLHLVTAVSEAMIRSTLKMFPKGEG